MTLTSSRAPVRKARAPEDEALNREMRRFGRDLTDALGEVAASAKSEAMTNAIAAGSAAAATAAVNLDPLYSVISNQQDRLAGEHLRQALTIAGSMPPAEAVLFFDVIEPKAVNYAALRSGALIRDVQQQVRDTVNGLVVDALQGDYTARTLAAQIERVVPLTSRQARTVENTYRKTFDRLIGSGTNPLKADALAQKAADRVAAQSLARRAEGIARTELMTASNAGRFDGFASTIATGLDSQESRKEWITGGNPCPDCDPLDGEVVQWDEEFTVGLLTPPVHPSCRCVIAFLPAARVEKRRDSDGNYTFEPTLGQAIRLAQIARDYLLGRMPKPAHDEAWDRILGFRRE